MKLTYKHTRIACYINFLTDAVNNIFLGLLFTTFSAEFGIDITRLAVITSVVFGVQAVVIPLASMLTCTLGFRKMAVTMQILNFIGVAGIAVFPYVFPSSFMGLIAAAFIYSIGNGICEGTNNAMFESLPSDNKDAEMNRLHSVFSWGQVLVVLTSTIFFNLIGRERWQILAILFAIIPLCNLFLFLKVPFGVLCEESERTPLLKIISQKLFIFLMIIMLCNGPVEMCMAQWTSLFAEAGLHVSKTVGDLLGPCLFAIGMGISRIFFGIKGGSMKIEKTMVGCGLGCFLSYMIIVFASNPLISLMGCGLVGLSTGIICPGVICILSKNFPTGGVPMFGALTLFQYLGNAVTNNMIGKMTTYVEMNVPAIAVKMFPVTDSFELGLRSSLFIVGLMAFVMFVFISIVYKYTEKHGLSR